MEAAPTIRDPAAWRWVVQHRKEIDAWRRRRAELRRSVAQDVFARELVAWEQARANLLEARRLAAEIAAGCPRAGADEYQRYILTAWSPFSGPGSDAAERWRWDKRIQRVRQWVLARLPSMLAVLLRRGRGSAPPRPTIHRTLSRLARLRRAHHKSALGGNNR